MQTIYSEKASELISSIMIEISPILQKKPFEKEINYISCKVEILNNDFATVWVKWGKYDCEFKNLPITEMALVADCIIRD